MQNSSTKVENSTSVGGFANTMLGDVFSLFCSDDELRPAMMKPFLQNGKVYATDPWTVIFANQNDIDFDYTNEYLEKAPNVEKVIPMPNTSKILNVKIEDFEKYKTEDEYEDTGEDIECKTCDGTGEVEWEFEMWTKDFDCPKCDGTGYSEEKKQRKTGNKTFGVYRVKMGEIYFDMKKFYRLLQVQNLLGCEIELIHSSSPTSIHCFNVGICTVCLMPCPLDRDDDCEGVLNIA